MTKIDEQIDIYNGTAPHIKLNRKIFFDESNNIRKGKIGIDKDNNEDLENLYFTLGGIATKKRDRLSRPFKVYWCEANAK